MAYDPFDPYAGDVDPNTGMPIEQPEPEKPKRSPLNPNAPSDADLIKWYQVGPHRDPSADELAGWRSGLFTDPAASPEYIQNQIMQSGETSAWTAAHPQTGKMDDGGGSSYTPGGSSYRPGLGASGSSGGNALVKYLLSEGMNPASSNPAFRDRASKVDPRCNGCCWISETSWSTSSSRIAASTTSSRGCGTTRRARPGSSASPP